MGRHKKKVSSATVETDALNRAAAHLEPLLKTASPASEQSAGVAAPPAGEDKTSPAVLVSPEINSALGATCANLADNFLEKYFGPSGRLPVPLAVQAAAAWAAVLDYYMPTIASGGPLTQLGLIYAAHLSTVVLSMQSAPTSAAPDPAQAADLGHVGRNGNQKAWAADQTGRPSPESSENAATVKPL